MAKRKTLIGRYREISKELDLSEDDVKRAIDLFLSTIKQELIDNGETRIENFFSANLTTKKKYQIFCHWDNKMKTIGPIVMVNFKTSPNFRKYVREGIQEK